MIFGKNMNFYVVGPELKKAMPSPPRESNSRIAYTRWEPVTDETDEQINTNNNVSLMHLSKKA